MARKKTLSKKRLGIEILKSVFSFWGLILLILIFRWLILEPFVIPSGSMIPTLLIRDHIVVSKMAYGIRKPFSNSYLWRRGLPKRGDIVVFSAVKDEREVREKLNNTPKILRPIFKPFIGSKFMIKRVVGLPGDSVFVDEKEGEIWLNNKKVPLQPIKDPKNSTEFYQLSERSLGARYEDYQFFIEETKDHRYRVMKSLLARPPYPSRLYEVPEDFVFVMGDNRRSSSDSRDWGYLPVGHIRGRAFGIWLSCEEGFISFSILCNISTMRWKRIFMGIK